MKFFVLATFAASAAALSISPRGTPAYGVVARAEMPAVVGSVLDLSHGRKKRNFGNPHANLGKREEARIGNTSNARRAAAVSSAASSKPTSNSSSGDDEDCDDDGSDDDGDDDDCDDDGDDSGSPSSVSAAPVKSTPAPTSTKAASSAAPKPSNAAGGSAGVGPVFSGTATWFTQDGNPGNCGNYNSDSTFLVALTTANYGDGQHCGKTVIITRTDTGKSIRATVQDSCPGCGVNGLDLSTGAFDALADASLGVFTMTWQYAS